MANDEDVEFDFSRKAFSRVIVLALAGAFFAAVLSGAIAVGCMLLFVMKEQQTSGIPDGEAEPNPGYFLKIVFKIS